MITHRNLPAVSLVSLGIAALSAGPAFGQYLLSGRAWMPRFEGSTELHYFTAALVFGSPEGAHGQSVAFRTWQTEPAGWYRLSGNAGRWTVLFAGPGPLMRPVVLTNQFLDHGQVVGHNVAPTHDYAMFAPAGWDNAPANAYYQTFVARSRSLTHVTFLLAHDGVDGEGLGSQTLLASVHRRGPGTPDTWEQVGPTMPVPGVDSGGSKSLLAGVGWNSGEVPLEPGQTYAVCLRAEKPNMGFQCLWREDTIPDAECYRVGKTRTGYTGRDMWMSIAGDCDGLLVPYNKRVQQEWVDLTRFGRKWSQTYVARGHSLAGAMLYVAVATSQPPLPEQRAWVRIRRGGPDGPVVGTAKIAVGQSTATAEAGLLGAAFAPGEVPLEPGQRYAVEFEAFGPHKGFNPYRKHPRDAYEAGEAFFNGEERVAYDLDMMIVEYEHSATDWANATTGRNLVANGDFQMPANGPSATPVASGLRAGRSTERSTNAAQGNTNRTPDTAQPAGWTRFATDPGTAWWYMRDPDGNRYPRILGGSISGKTIDGGLVQRVTGLSRVETYRLSAKVRSSWAVDEKHQALIGYDPTGQETDPRAPTIVWTVLPHIHGIFDAFTSPPIRPEKDAVSIWLRARTTFIEQKPFEVDFDDVDLRQVNAGTPGPANTTESPATRPE